MLVGLFVLFKLLHQDVSLFRHCCELIVQARYPLVQILYDGLVVLGVLKPVQECLARRPLKLYIL